jgi:hypothetical protein
MTLALAVLLLAVVVSFAVSRGRPGRWRSRRSWCRTLDHSGPVPTKGKDEL